MRGWRDGAKRRKDAWTWTRVWGLLGGGDIRGLNGNGKNIIMIKVMIIKNTIQNKF